MFKWSKYYLSWMLIWIMSSQVLAQDLGGLALSPYSGVQGVSAQPAFLGDLAFKWDVNIIGASANLLIKDLIPQSSISNTFYEGDKGSLSSVVTSKSQNYFVNAKIYLPSVAYKINNKSAISFNWGIRAVGFGRVTSGSFGLLLETENGLREIASLPKLESAVGMVNSWQDLGISYGRNIFDSSPHKLNLGVTAKYLIGGGSGFVEFSNIEVDYDEVSNTIADIDGEITLVFNDDIEKVASGDSKKLFNSSGFGFNFGLIYEFQDERHLNREIDRVGEPNYLFRLSTSVSDIGQITFNASDKSAYYDLSLDESLNPDYFDDVTGLGDLTSRLDNAFDLNKNDFYKYNLRLPTTWSTNLDWNVYSQFYVNGLISIAAIDMRTDIFKSQALNSYQLGLRYEKPKYGFYTTLAYDEFSKGGVSISARYSVLYVGVSNLFKFKADDSIRTLGLMAMVRVPILNKSKKGARNIF